MDPNAALQNARDALERLYAEEEGSDPWVGAACDLADAFDALDAWLKRGGFLPHGWRTAVYPPLPPLPSSTETDS